MFKHFIITFLCLIVAFLAWSAIVRGAYGEENTKVIDINNWDHRYALALAVGLREGWTKIVRIPEELRDYAAVNCLKFSFMSGYPFIKLPIGMGPMGVLCMSPPSALSSNDNVGWKDMCDLFNLKYVSNPTTESVLCEKKEEAKFPQRFGEGNRKTA